METPCSINTKRSAISVLIVVNWVLIVVILLLRFVTFVVSAVMFVVFVVTCEVRFVMFVVLVVTSSINAPTGKSPRPCAPSPA